MRPLHSGELGTVAGAMNPDAGHLHYVDRYPLGILADAIAERGHQSDPIRVLAAHLLKIDPNADSSGVLAGLVHPATPEPEPLKKGK